MTALFLICSLVLTPGPDNLVQPVTASSQILIPAAGTTPGAQGTFFTSDIAIINLRQTAQRVRLDWMPQGGEQRRDPLTIEIDARSGVRFANFVAEVLQIVGLGSILVSGVTETGTHDLGALLHVTSRIWTPQPGTNGTTSQSLPVVPVSTINTPAASIFGLRHSEQYRVNIGLVNLDLREQTFQISDPSAPTTPPLVAQVTVPPLSMQQITLQWPADVDTPQYLIDNITPAASRSNLWLTYGVSVDNVTGDSWSQLGVTGAR